MKSDHRHELKTNELAEWLINFPQWTKDNLTTIVCVLGLIVVVAVVYFWKFYGKESASAKRQIELTSYVNQLTQGKIQIINAQAQGKDMSFILLQPAGNLKRFAETEQEDLMAALALIKQAEAMRTDLHYRPGTVPQADLIAQINDAKAGYTEALRRAASNPLLMAMAKFGLGLCEEEIGNFKVAEQIYREITEEPNFEGTAPVVQAKYRLNTMADYQERIVFKPSPRPEPPFVMPPFDANLPGDSNVPSDVNVPVDIASLLADSIPVVKTPAEANQVPAPNNVSVAAEPNVAVKEPNGVSGASKVNLPARRSR